MNPLLPLPYFIPDVEARQWADGRVYLYGSTDISGGDTYCSHELHVFSSADLANWTHHGESFRSAGPGAGVPWSQAPLYAPDCICRDGVYYLFFCLADRTEGVAVSDSPAGPFTQATPVAGAERDGIDPAVLLDDDGEVYYYWGQHNLRGARMRPDLRGLVAESVQRSLINEEEHGFHEGASIRKRNGVYYLVYTDISRGRATCMAYATSRAPLGPFEKRGILIDNSGCDPETWNNHGSIAEINGEWYLFYHRSSQATRYNRRVCVERLHFNADGSIDPVEMTTQGLAGPLNARWPLEAARACLMSGYVRIEAGETGEHLARIHAGDWASFKYVDFGAGAAACHLRAGSLSDGGEVEVRLDAPDGALVGTLAVERTAGWQDWRTVSTPVRGGAGVHALYLVFRGREGRLMDVKDLWFS